jgi:hypothetical protein
MSDFPIRELWRQNGRADSFWAQISFNKPDGSNLLVPGVLHNGVPRYGTKVPYPWDAMDPILLGCSFPAGFAGTGVVSSTWAVTLFPNRALSGQEIQCPRLSQCDLCILAMANALVDAESVQESDIVFSAVAASLQFSFCSHL